MSLNWLSLWEKRASLRTQTDAFRLVNGPFSGFPDLVVEIFGKYAVFFSYSEPAWLSAPQNAADLCTAIDLAGAVLIDRSRKPGPERRENHLLVGEVPHRLPIREGELQFEVFLRHPQNVGLFLDTRHLRYRLRETCSGQRVLNLFAYTCSLGLAATRGGAESVANVDVSSQYLRQGKLNYALNSAESASNRFHRMDAEEYLDWAIRKELVFDTILLDPPSFSRNRGKTYAFERDYFRLVRKCALLTAPKGRLFALTNFTGVRGSDFKAQLESALLESGRRGEAMEFIEPPEDFDLREPRAGISSEYAGSLILSTRFSA